jgi:Fe(3+) dicitrate transport protein
MIGTNDRTYHSWGLQGLGRWRHETDRLSSTLQWGFRLHGDQVERLHSEDPYAMVGGFLSPVAEPTQITTENKGSSLAFSAHLHEELGLGPVRLLPGLRLEVIRGRLEDRLTDEDSVATRAVVLPGFGLYVQPTPWLGLLAGIHRGFSPVAPGQPEEVKAEESWNVEAGLRAAHRGGQAEVIGFFNDYRNMTGQCTLSAGCPEDLLDRQHNGGQVHVYGLEAQLSYRAALPKGFSVEPRLSYTWTGSSFQTSFDSPSPHFGSVIVGDRLAYVPEHRGSASVGIEHHLGGVQVSVSAQTAMRDLPGQGELTAGESVPAMVSVDLNAQLRLARHAQIYVTLTNITNEAHMISRRPYGARPVRPFHAMIGVKLALTDQGEGIIDILREKS